MFDRVVLQPRSPDVHNHVTVQQKPHDAADAARLYGELEAKAVASIENRQFHDVPSIDAKFLSYELMPYDRSRRIAFKINGRHVTVRIGQEDPAQEFVLALARELLGEIPSAQLRAIA